MNKNTDSGKFTNGIGKVLDDGSESHENTPTSI